MNFQDLIHGEIYFQEKQIASLVIDLINSPELQRLRRMRLVNFDVPYIQELSTSRRFSHTIGTAYLAYCILPNSNLDLNMKKVLISAALLHDIGILPYGHLVETELGISHETLVRKILFGTYHATNKYHQILPGISLRVHSILDKHDIDRDAVMKLIFPPKGSSSPITGDIDLDNIDNVFRMGALLGILDARSHVANLSQSIRVNDKFQLIFDDNAIESVDKWLELRKIIYKTMIAHPQCVPYNAFLQDLVQLSIQHKVIDPDEWFLSDQEFENRLLQHNDTKNLAKQLIVGNSYGLVDYVWMRFGDDICVPDRITGPQLQQLLESPPVEGLQYFIWQDMNKINRRVKVKTEFGHHVRLGTNRSSILISLVNPGIVSQKSLQEYETIKLQWRERIIRLIGKEIPHESTVAFYPEDFPTNLLNKDANEFTFKF